MKPKAPCANRFVEDKENERLYKQHIQNMHNMKPSIDSNLTPVSNGGQSKKKQTHHIIFDGDKLAPPPSRQKTRPATARPKKVCPDISKSALSHVRPPIKTARDPPSHNQELSNGKNQNLKIHRPLTALQAPLGKLNEIEQNKVDQKCELETLNVISSEPQKTIQIKKHNNSVTSNSKGIARKSSPRKNDSEEEDSDNSDIFAEAFGAPIEYTIV